MLTLALAILTPGAFAGHLITPLWILTIFVVLGSFSYVAAYTIGRLSYLFGNGVRREDGREAPLPLRPVEGILIAM